MTGSDSVAGQPQTAPDAGLGPAIPGSAGPRLSIGRLTLDVPWMSEQEARQLAVLVAEALRHGAAGRQPRAAGRTDRVGVDVPQPRAGGTDLAGPIARAVLDALLKEPA